MVSECASAAEAASGSCRQPVEAKDVCMLMFVIEFLKDQII